MDAIEAYWMSRDPSMVSDLASAAKQSLDFLSATPGAGAPLEQSGLRKWRVGRTPFLFFYRFDRQFVRVIRVRHEREDWRRTR
jgi:plasmid stabilization system protein ParE